MTLNKLAFSLVGSLALATTGFAGTAPSGKACKTCCAPAPQDDSLGITATIGYDSSYVFRGINLADNWVSAAIDWSLPLTNTVKLNLGASYGSSAGDSFLGIDGVSFERLELAAGLTADLGGAELGLGYRWYHNMGDADLVLDDAHEVGLTVATKVGPLNVGAGAYYDFQGEGWYFEVGVNTEVKVTESISLVPGASIGYHSDYTWGFDRAIAGNTGDGFTAVNLSLALPIKLTKTATLTPFIAWNLPIDALEDEDDQIHGGVSISVKF
jgi:hypothetical protein